MDIEITDTHWETIRNKVIIKVKELNLSYKEIANETGISVQSLRNYIKGKTFSLIPKSQCKLLTFLHLDYWYYEYFKNILLDNYLQSLESDK